MTAKIIILGITLSIHLLILIGLIYCFYGCTSYDPCLSRAYKIKMESISKVNNGIYFLCYMEEEPVIHDMDSSLENSFPWYLHGSLKYLENPRYLRQVEDIGVSKSTENKVITYIIIKLKVKPIDMYFTKYSYDNFRGLNMDIRNGKIPSKEPFLQFSTLYYVTCNSSDINSFKKIYDKKELVLLDKKYPETEVDYFYSFNGYPANKVDFSKLYSFDEVVYHMEQNKTGKAFYCL